MIIYLLKNLEKGKYIVIQSFFIFAALLFLLVVIEGILRLQSFMDTVSSDNLSEIRIDGISLFQPHADMIIMGGTGVPIRVKTNAEGFAGPECSIVVPTNTIRAAFLGNSFTLGFEVDFDKKFTGLLEKKLNDSSLLRGNPHYEIMNFAHSAYSVVEQLIIYEKFVKKYHPDIVVLVLYSGFDFQAVRQYINNKEEILNTPPSELTIEDIYHISNQSTASEQNSKSFRAFISSHSYVIRYLIKFIIEHDRINRAAIALHILHRPFSRDVANYYGELWSYMDPNSAPHLEIMNFTANVVKKLAETVKADGAEFRLVLIPSYWQVDKKYIKKLRETQMNVDIFLPNRIIREALPKECRAIDLSDEISEAINIKHQQIFIHDISHFTAAGHILAAEKLVEFFEKNYKK